MLLGRLRLDIPKAIEVYTFISENTFITRIGKGTRGQSQGKFSSKVLQDVLNKAFQQLDMPVEMPLQDPNPNGCKVWVK